MGIRMLVVEDHTLVRQAIVSLLADDDMIEVVGEASNGSYAVAKACELQPDVVLMDLYMPGIDGIAATRLIKRELPDTQVILLTVSNDENDILKAVQAGARGYILKNSDATSVIQQIKQVISGRVALSDVMVGKLLCGLANDHPAALADTTQPITPREREVLELISHGTTNKEISTALSISENTVRAHVRSLMQKLNLYNRTQLAVYKIREGFGLASGNHRNQDVASQLANGKVPQKGRDPSFDYVARTA
jgi:two-component system nitrate/nitrite response regulator NarL